MCVQVSMWFSFHQRIAHCLAMPHTPTKINAINLFSDGVVRIRFSNTFSLTQNATYTHTSPEKYWRDGFRCEIFAVAYLSNESRFRCLTKVHIMRDLTWLSWNAIRCLSKSRYGSFHKNAHALTRTHVHKPAEGTCVRANRWTLNEDEALLIYNIVPPHRRSFQFSAKVFRSFRLFLMWFWGRKWIRIISIFQWR